MTVALSDTCREPLQKEAARRGVSSEVIVSRLVDAFLEGAVTLPADAAESDRVPAVVTPQEKADAMMRWLDSHDHRAPALPSSAVSRAAIYSDEGGES